MQPASRKGDKHSSTAINARNPYLQGIYAPVEQEVTLTDCKVIGEIPRDLYGAYVRNGPNPLKAPQDLHHWFDGDGMLHSVYFENGKAEYRNRYVRSDDFIADSEGRCDVGGVMLPANRERAPKVYKDTANTDILPFAGGLLALWYISGTPVSIDPRTLETLGNESFQGKLPRHVSAHSKTDPVTGDFVFFDYALYEPWMSYGVVNAERELVNFQQVDLPGPRLPHDMAITENYAILHDLPVVFTEQALRRGQWSIEQRKQPARFGVVPRLGKSADIRWFETDPCYIYHVINAWEEGDEVIMHACRMLPNGMAPDVSKYGSYAAMVTVLALRAVPWEWRMNMRTGAVTSRQLDERFSEFPVINLDYCGRKTRYGYIMSIADTETQRFDGIYKYDLENGHCDAHHYPAGVFGCEAAFAPRVGATEEDDGYLVVYTIDENSQASEVQILDARALEQGPLARIVLPCRVPAGFHATWIRGDQMEDG